MLSKKLFIIGVITFGGVSACAQLSGKPEAESAASSQAKPMQKHGTRIDENGDRLISRSEAAAHPRLAQQFDAIDTNKDGSLDMQEMHAHHQARMKEHHQNVESRFKEADTDRDGALTKAEAEAANIMPVVHHFAQLDTDQNGKVTMAELQAPGMQHRGHGAHGGHGGGKHGGANHMEKPQEKSKYY